jgi:hypothetical protein
MKIKDVSLLLLLVLILMDVETALSGEAQNRKEDEVVAKHTEGVYQIPFGSSGNSIDLSIENVSSYTTENIKVKVIQPPAWIKFKTEEQSINNIESNTEKMISYTFSVDKDAPVNTKQTLNFNITTPSGEIWNKQITVSVAPPQTYELFQNYPNPFNPVTTIAYQIPEAGRVNLKIYDILGREVATLVDETREAGYFEIDWDGGRIASGVYVYQVTVKAKEGKVFTAHKKFMLLK